MSMREGLEVPPCTGTPLIADYGQFWHLDGQPAPDRTQSGGWPCPADHHCSTPVRDLFANLSTPSFPAASEASAAAGLRHAARLRGQLRRLLPAGLAGNVTSLSSLTFLTPMFAAAGGSSSWGRP